MQIVVDHNKWPKSGLATVGSENRDIDGGGVGTCVSHHLQNLRSSSLSGALGLATPLAFRVEGKVLVFRVEGLGSRVNCLVFSVECLGFSVWG
jgi:hypothetical protein